MVGCRNSPSNSCCRVFPGVGRCCISAFRDKTPNIVWYISYTCGALGSWPVRRSVFQEMKDVQRTIDTSIHMMQEPICPAPRRRVCTLSSTLSLASLVYARI
ncbi:unnamed protein product [Ectocarpus sp. 12 AP-2014]